MKSHVKLRLASGVAGVRAPHWRDLITTAGEAPVNLNPAIDAVLQRFGVPVRVTAEYAPAGAVWSPEERACGLDRVYRLILVQDQRVPSEMIREISRLATVDYAEVGRIGESGLPPARAAAFATPTDRHSREAIHLPEAHAFTRGHPEIKIAVLDTGVSLDHEEYAGVLKSGNDLVDIIDGAGEFVGDYLDADPVPDDEVGHGTHVAGIISAQGRAMPMGVAPDCTLLPVRVLAAMRRGDEVVGAGLIDNINVAVKWAVDQGVDVINMSLGVPHERGGLPHEEVVAYAQQKGVTIVAASGNDGQNSHYYPAGLPHVITVGAVDEGGGVAAFSTWGKHVDLVAPGTNIYSTYLNNGYAFSTGTSHAAPFVTGVVALLKAQALALGQSLSDSQIKHIVSHTADRVDHRFKHPRAGFGRVNALDALRLVNQKLNQPMAMGV